MLHRCVRRGLRSLYLMARISISWFHACVTWVSNPLTEPLGCSLRPDSFTNSLYMRAFTSVGLWQLTLKKMPNHMPISNFENGKRQKSHVRLCAKVYMFLIILSYSSFSVVFIKRNEQVCFPNSNLSNTAKMGFKVLPIVVLPCSSESSEALEAVA